MTDNQILNKCALHDCNEVGNIQIKDKFYCGSCIGKINERIKQKRLELFEQVEKEINDGTYP